jgi:type I restriction enzyme S subunit
MSYLLSPKAQDHIAQNKADVARANFNLDDIKVMPIPLPPYPEQQEITQQVNVLRAWADAVQRRVEAGLARVEKLTQAVLEKAFRGELVTTEAELARQEGRDYEPASVLLDRIRAERGDVVPKTSRGGARRRGATQQVELL